MAHRVDHEARRHRIAEALWRVAADRGLDGVGLRDVAAEAGVSLGQLQHWFSGKDELLLFAMQRLGTLATGRVEQRLRDLDGPPSPLDVVRAVAAELLPLDDESRTGLLVHVAFLARTVHDPALRDLTRDGVRPLTDLLAGQIGRAIEAGDVDPDRDPEIEATLLVSLAEGLSNYALLDVHTPEHAARVMDAHLDALFRR